jgi:hypothetical protein
MNTRRGKPVPDDPYLYRRWAHVEASSAAQLHGWLEDIDAASDLLLRLQIEVDRDPADGTLLDGLASAAVVRYARCFASGLRGTLDADELLGAAGGADAAIHERLLGIRNWHVAHAINKQEAHTLVVIIDPRPGAPNLVAGFSSRSARELPLELADIAAAIALCERWRAFLVDCIVRENKRLLPFAAALTRTELLGLPDDEVEPSSNIRAKRQQSVNRKTAESRQKKA